jgi:tRNA threonylcarbamoyladenosine biosynthesis protein TsaE
MNENTVIDLLDREATLNLGKKLGETLAAGSVILLKGDLGAGKTTLVQGIGLGLGIQEPISSPTFTLVNEYVEGRLPLYHLDLYRLESSDIEALYLENYWQGIEVDLGIVAIEWSERLTILPDEYLEITLLDRGEQGRQALLNFVGKIKKNSDPKGIAIST